MEFNGTLKMNSKIKHNQKTNRMKKYFLKDSHEPISFDDVIKVTRTSYEGGKPLKEEVECTFSPEMIPYLLAKDWIIEEEVEEPTETSASVDEETQSPFEEREEEDDDDDIIEEIIENQELQAKVLSELIEELNDLKKELRQRSFSSLGFVI